ncbi:lipoamide acyltransferase component of branched-chain alpha-keto acid dehydrogenase complex, mitochondrial [Onthophagus taurus]|uniref:lipoamide acyltransferase component of branched-chain alpha-keto acid dehydrogenase complex, mitochondrial n=1 Tax=Onthophagus taurus TaxID=166361 RepID=UPI000C206A4C|nr:lipoamide acyltransferase component of branched-chain alpha-keto acid dehydrogenase complex, mitochondrial [Onthophagus taurus]
MSVANGSLKLISGLYRVFKVKPIFGSSLNTNNFQRFLHVSTNFNGVVSFKLADIGEGIKDVVIKEWFVKEGDKVSQFDNICEVQSDKASVTITSRYDGIVKKLHHKVDSIALVGKPLLDIEVEGEESSSSSSESDVSDGESKKEPQSAQKDINEINDINIALCIPSVRRLAKEHNINLSEIRGTGKKGRILKEDVIRYLESKKVPAIPRETQPIREFKSAEIKTRSDRIEPLKGFQRAMIKTMSEALKIPHFLLCEEITVTKLTSLRKSIKQEAENQGIKLTMMPFFIKAASNALSRNDVLNATFDSNSELVTYHGAHNIGVAMDTKIGLAVPIIKNVDQLTILEIAQELNRLMVSGKEGNFRTQDLQGGTFTLSNIGIIAGTYAAPVILPPQVAILAIGATQTLPRFDKDKNLVAEDVLNVSGSGDHRIVDGASMARFLKDFKKQLEEPNYLFLNL